MPDIARYAVRFSLYECAKIHVFQNEFGALDVLIKTSAQRSEKARTTPMFIPYESEETSERNERDEDEIELFHGD